MKKSQFVFQLAAGGVLVLVSIYGFLLLNGTWLPQDALGLLDQSLGAEKRQVSLDGGKVEERIELEYYLCRRISGKQVGDRILLEFSGEGMESSRSVPLISYFEAHGFPHIHLIVMGLSTLIGFVVFVMKKEDVRARLLYWGILTFAVAEVITGGFHCLDVTWTSYIPAVFFYICYALADLAATLANALALGVEVGFFGTLLVRVLSSHDLACVGNELGVQLFRGGFLKKPLVEIGHDTLSLRLGGNFSGCGRIST